MAELKWQTPIVLAPTVRSRVEAEVERLTAQILSRWDQEPEGFGFIQGKVGMSFAFYELAAAGVPETDVAAERALVGAVDLFNAGGANPGLHSGVAGLGWLVDAWVGEEDLCTPIDDSLRERVELMTEAKPLISLRAGLTGIGLYACRRVDRAHSARALLASVSHALVRSSQRTPQGLTWNTPRSYLMAREGKPLFPNENERKVIREWGVAHGVAPLALLLSQLEKHQIPGAAETRESLEWIWASTHREPNRFGWLWADGDRAELNRSAWCTGDPGVALSCWLAASAVGLREEQARWLELGHQLARRITGGERFSLEGRIDLCCGLSGVTQAFSSWAAVSGDPLLADAARALLMRLLDEVQKTDLAQMSLHLQFGVTGVALTLLAQLTHKAPAWAGPLAMTYPDARTPRMSGEQPVVP